MTRTAPRTPLKASQDCDSYLDKLKTYGVVTISVSKTSEVLTKLETERFGVIAFNSVRLDFALSELLKMVRRKATLSGE